MKRVIACFGLLLALLMLGACGDIRSLVGPGMTPVSASSLPAGNVAHGKEVFYSQKINCTSCHPNGGRGFGPRITGQSPDTIATVARNGRGNMPAYPKEVLSDQDLSDIIAFVKSLQ